jgi:tyrosinase
MMEIWIRVHPAAQYTSAFPIQPFIGSSAATIAEFDPRRWRYTTIGDMARDSRAIGYDYGHPVTPDWRGDAQAFEPTQSALTVVFSDVRCTLDSYTIDAFLNQSAPNSADVDPLNKHYIGRFSRIGMGLEDDKGRCIRHGVTRQLDATPNARALGLASGSACDLSLLVRKLATGETVSPEVYRSLPGFEGRLVWTGLWAAPVPQSNPADGSCCAAD